MATWGWTSPAFNSWRYTGQNTDNNVSSGPAAFPEAGTVTAIVFYCAGRLGTITAQGGIWNSSGGLVGNGSAISVGQGSQSTNGQGWQSSPCSVVLTAGQIVCIGWWRNPALGSDCVWSYAPGGTEYNGTTAGSSSIGSFGHDLTYSTTPGVYLVYTPTGSGPGPAPPIIQPIVYSRGSNKIQAMMENEVLPK